MKIARNVYAISVKELIMMLQTLPNDAVVYSGSDRLSIAQPNNGEWVEWELLTSIILDHDQPYFWISENPSTKDNDRG